MRKVKMFEGEDRHIGDEYSDAIAHFYDIITEVAKKHIDNKYEVWVENWADTVYQGLPIEYNIQYLNVYLVDKSTKREIFIGRIDIGDNRLDNLTEEEIDNGYVALYSDDYIREQAEELFKWWKEKGA